MADFRALCAELVEKLDELNCDFNVPSQSALIERSCAALAQPEPQGPTDAELITMWATTRYIDQPEGGLAYGRAVLARFGRPAIERVPVSERLPGPEDCDAEGRCWLHGPHLLGDEAAWVYGYPVWAQRFSDVYSHWLPHWALPVPVVEGADA